jgi:NAD(P)-dependent dehydrogenase (short-subunit alcohol dehydrogenase family)
MNASDGELHGRVALVTGGGRGIGRGIALVLAKAGADVAIAFRRDRDAADATVSALKALGVRAKAYPAVMEVREQCQALVAAAVTDFGGIDILVNNAGIASRGKSVADTDPDEVTRVLTVHALAPHWLSQAVLPSMRTRGRGDIVMISSVATLGFAANGAPYAMGKAAMEALAYTLAKEERRNGIHVNVVAPGLVDTDMGRRLAAATTGVKDIHELDARMPFGRVCQPEDIGEAVRFLVSPRASYITGEKINVHGGGQSWH